jgi:hypothetical protein
MRELHAISPLLERAAIAFPQVTNLSRLLAVYVGSESKVSLGSEGPVNSGDGSANYVIPDSALGAPTTPVHLRAKG